MSGKSHALVRSVSIVVALATLRGFPCLPQEAGITFDQLTISDGLSNASITAIAQDSVGFIWIGTEDGLNCYNGYSTEVYKHHPRDSTSLPNNIIVSLCIDRGGTVWVSTGRGLCRLDRSTNRFVRVNLDPESDELDGSGYTGQIGMDSRGMLWVPSLMGVHEIDPASGARRHFRFDIHRLAGLTIDQGDALWVHQMGGDLIRIDPKNGNVKRFVTGRADGHNPSAGINAIAAGPDGSMWLATNWGGLNRIRPDGQFQYYYNDPHNPKTVASNMVNSVHLDLKGSLWVGTWNEGLDYFDEQRNAFVHYRSDSGDPRSLASNRIQAIFQDNSGTMWVGTWRGGISRYDPRRRKFVHHRVVPDGVLTSESVTALLRDRTGKLWVGTETMGLAIQDSRTGSYKYFRHDPRTSSSLPSNTVNVILQDRSGAVWVGVAGGVCRFNDARGGFERYKITAGYDEVRCLLEDRDGMLWAATHAHSSLAYFDRSRDRFVRVTLPDTLDAINSLLEDRDGALWIATFGRGLHRYDKRSGKFEQLLPNDKDAASAEAHLVYTLALDPRGDVWAGLYSGGLVRYDRQSNGFTYYTEADGLQDNFIKGVLADDHGNLWLSSMKGLCRFNSVTKAVKHFSIDDGLQGNEFRSGSCFKDADGTMYFGGVNGFNVFHPDSIRDNPFPPRVVVTGFSVLDKPYPLQDERGTEAEIALSYDQDVFSFEFVALNFTNADKNQYAYMMEGFDRSWNYCGTRRHATYTHLDPGEYVFRVKASNNDGVWNEAGASVKLMIIPPYWMRWWFRIAVVVVVFGSIGWIIRSLEIRKIRARMERLQREAELERERARISRDMHDDLGARLTEIRLLSELCRREVSESMGTSSKLEEISTNAREVVDSFQEIIWSVNPRYDTLDNLADFLTQYASRYLGKAGLRCRLDIPADAPALRIPAAVRHNVMMVVKEVLNNSVKHAQACEVNVKLSWAHDGLTIAIRDDGRGFDPTEVSQFGNGLANMRNRLEAIGGQLTVESSIGQGTSVLISVGIPMDK